MPRPRTLLCASLTLALICVSCQRIPVSGASSSSSGTDGGTTTIGTTGVGSDTSPDSGGSDKPIYECDPVLQDCDPGQKCTAVEAGGKQNLYECVEDPGGRDIFDPCTADAVSGVDGCDPGLVCLENDQQVGLCVEHCVADVDCEFGVCLRHPLTFVPYCALECDPFVPVCELPTACRRDRDRFACQFPRASDDGFILDPCLPGDDSGCGSGVVCIEGALIPGCESGGCCSPICDTTEPGSDDACAANLSSAAASCVQLFSSPAPGFENYGACLVPA